MLPNSNKYFRSFNSRVQEIFGDEDCLRVIRLRFEFSGDVREALQCLVRLGSPFFEPALRMPIAQMHESAVDGASGAGQVLDD